jgi:hypothetical protein
VEDTFTVPPAVYGEFVPYEEAPKLAHCVVTDATVTADEATLAVPQLPEETVVAVYVSVAVNAGTATDQLPLASAVVVQGPAVVPAVLFTRILAFAADVPVMVVAPAAIRLLGAVTIGGSL